MRTTTASIRCLDLRRVALVAFAAGAVAIASTRVYAGDPAAIDVSATALAEDYGICVRDAVASAQRRVGAAISRAQAAATGRGAAS